MAAEQNLGVGGIVKEVDFNLLLGAVRPVDIPIPVFLIQGLHGIEKTNDFLQKRSLHVGPPFLPSGLNPCCTTAWSYSDARRQAGQLILGRDGEKAGWHTYGPLGELNSPLAHQTYHRAFFT